MLEDHDIKDRQVHEHLQPAVLGILACYVVIMAVGYLGGESFLTAKSAVIEYKKRADPLTEKPFFVDRY